MGAVIWGASSLLALGVLTGNTDALRKDAAVAVLVSTSAIRPESPGTLFPASIETYAWTSCAAAAGA